MNAAHPIEHVSLAAFLREPSNEHSYAAIRSRLLDAISLAEFEGYSSTHEALIELLRELDANSVSA